MAHPAKLAFFGTDEFSDTTLRALIDHGYRVEIVITKPDAPVGRKRIMTPPAVKVTAQSHNIRVLQPERASELVDAAHRACEAAIVVSYGKILPQSVLDLFPKGLINIHASLLPKYRGAAPIEAALLNGDITTGVSLMKLDAGMDTGPVYAQAEYEIEDEDTQATLYPKLASIGADLLIRELDDILEGSLQPTPQDDASASNVGMIKKADGIIDWNKSATEIERQVRAFVTWPGSKATIAGEEVTIASVEIINGTGKPGTPQKTESGDLSVYCDDGAVQINRLTPAGKREMTGKEFLAGHPID